MLVQDSRASAGILQQAPFHYGGKAQDFGDVAAAAKKFLQRSRMPFLEPGGRVTLTQRFEGREETRVITGFLTEMRTDVDHDFAHYTRPGGSQISLGGPMRETITFTVDVDTRGAETDEYRNTRAKEQTMQDPDNDFRFETVRDPRTKIITLYCRDVDNDELFYGWDLNPVEVPKGTEPPVFMAVHEDIFSAMKTAKPR